MDEYQEYKLFKTHPYVIVDAIKRDEVPPEWGQCIIAPKFLGKDTDRCPLLVDMRSLNADEANQYFQRLTVETHTVEET